MPSLPIADFLTARLKEFDPKFELRKGTAFDKVFFKPLQFIVQPLRDEADNIQTAQSFRQILLTDNPDAFDESQVDALSSNLFVDRAAGDKSSGVARVYYDNPVNREYPVNGATFVGNNGLNYVNPGTFAITEAAMSSQLEGGLYFYDIPLEAETAGANTALDPGGIVSILNDAEAVSVTNKLAFKGGLDRETNTQLIERTKNSIAVRDLVVGKGFNAILFENFVGVITELQPIGLNDKEMMRDILFNTHVGGKIDGYFKTNSITTTSKDFVGLLVDSTRQAFGSTNIQLTGTDFLFVGNPNVDRSNGKTPLVQQVKVATQAAYTSPVNISSPIDLSVNKDIKITIDGSSREISLSGANPGATTRNEIVALINIAFGLDVAVGAGSAFKIVSPTEGLTSEIVIDNPTVGVSCILEVFGLSSGGAPHTFRGDGPITFTEGFHYQWDDEAGDLKRVVGPLIGIYPQTTGHTTHNVAGFTDSTPSAFAAAEINDILSIETGADAGDYRILSIPDNNTLVLDEKLTATATGIQYSIRRTGIKDGEFVYAAYYFNPLSIDVGKFIPLDALGATRGIRPGRDAYTITDVAFLRIKTIELIDPVTFEPLGTVLAEGGGFGQGGFGEGPFGIGSSSDYYLVVNTPTARFSAFEDSYIVLKPTFQGFSVKVTYDCVPEVEELHNFVRSDNERVLDGDILMKHLLPAYVSGTITYSVDNTDTSIPDNVTLQALVVGFINSRKAGTPLEYSDITQFMLRKTDPFDRFSSFIEPYTLTAIVHNADGSTTVVEGAKRLVVPTLTPFPRQTDKPLSPRITHWIADELTLVRV